MSFQVSLFTSLFAEEASRIGTVAKIHIPVFPRNKNPNRGIDYRQQVFSLTTLSALLPLVLFFPVSLFINAK